MFQIASTIGIAVHNGYEYGFPKWMNWDAKERFGTDEDIEVHNWFKPLPEVSVDLPDYFVHWGFWGLKHPDNRSYSGHMQSDKYFRHCGDLIKDQFTMENEKRNDYTAIHLRCGDYDGDYHPVMDIEYYKRAMNVIPGNYLIFSDDLKKAKEMFPNGELFEGNTRDSFKKMKECKNHIIANSTFSWWAAWLAGGKVVAPKNWFGPKAGLETKDIYPENWIVL